MSFNPTVSASHLAIGSNSTGRGLFSLTLSVNVFYRSAPVKVYQEAISLDVALLLTLGVILSYQSAPV